VKQLEAMVAARSGERSSSAIRRHWRGARLFQLAAHRALAALQVPFIEWLLLETVQELIEEKQDAVSQIEIAKRAGLTPMVASYWMIVMQEQGLVDRGPDSDGRAYRIYLSGLGERTLQECNERLEAAGLTG
jgi:DNA-binding MarR family transcriptional regulator